jgi:hypothetical protein
MTQIVEQMAREISISDTGGHVSVTMYAKSPEVSFKFCDAKNISRIKNGLNDISITRGTYPQGTLTNIVTALNVSLYKMFSVNNGARIGVPKTLIVITNGDCQICHNTTYKTYLTDIVKQFEMRKIRVILISTKDSYAWIKETYQVAITGEDNFHLIQNNDQLSKDDFIRNVSVCDGMFS